MLIILDPQISVFYIKAPIFYLYYSLIISQFLPTHKHRNPKCAKFSYSTSSTISDLAHHVFHVSRYAANSTFYTNKLIIIMSKASIIFGIIKNCELCNLSSMQFSTTFTIFTSQPFVTHTSPNSTVNNCTNYTLSGLVPRGFEKMAITNSVNGVKEENR